MVLALTLEHSLSGRVLVRIAALDRSLVRWATERASGVFVLPAAFWLSAQEQVPAWDHRQTDLQPPEQASEPALAWERVLHHQTDRLPSLMRFYLDQAMYPICMDEIRQ